MARDGLLVTLGASSDTRTPRRVRTPQGGPTGGTHGLGGPEVPSENSFFDAGFFDPMGLGEFFDGAGDAAAAFVGREFRVKLDRAAGEPLERVRGRVRGERRVGTPLILRLMHLSSHRVDGLFS